MALSDAAAPSAYGCADAAAIRYSLSLPPHGNDERQACIRVLQSLQESSTGFFRETPGKEIHTTAFCAAALDFFDEKPLYPVSALFPYRDPDKMDHFLDDLNWHNDPWNESHKGAGIYACLVLTGAVTQDWEDRYFRWLYDHTDAGTGFICKGHPANVRSGPTNSMFPHLASTFHYLFNVEYAHRPIRYPEALIDACLDIYNHRDAFPFGEGVGFAEVDWVYCLNRALRQCGHRFHDVQRALLSFTEEYVPFLTGLDPESHAGLNDLHCLFGAVCGLAELQMALPGVLRTERPLRQVLDRRPFI